MSRFVAQFVSSCAACQAAKGSTADQSDQLGLLSPTFFLKSLQVNGLDHSLNDFLDLPRSADGYNSLEVAKAFQVVDNVFCWFGLPTVLDRGPQCGIKFESCWARR